MVNKWGRLSYQIRGEGSDMFAEGVVRSKLLPGLLAREDDDLPSSDGGAQLGSSHAQKNRMA